MPPNALDPLAAVNPERLLTFLADRVDVGSTLKVEVVSGGLSNLTFLARTGDYEYIVRRGPLGEVPRGTHDMAREYRVQAALQASPLPVARMYGFSGDSAIVGAPFYVMSVVPGRVIQRPTDVADLTNLQARLLCEDVIETLVQLHAIDPLEVGLSELGRPTGFVRRHIGSWLDQWRKVEHRELPLVEMLGKYLVDNVPARADETLVHGDYRLGNLVVGMTGPGSTPEVAAVLDWELSTLGDPLTDLAHLLTYWEAARGRKTHSAQDIATEHGGFSAGSDLVQEYVRKTGRNVDDLSFYLVFEHWRAAIIKEGIYQRHLKGMQLRAEGSDQAVIGYLEEAAEIAGI